jgi:hypothetical protein
LFSQSSLSGTFPSIFKYQLLILINTGLVYLVAQYVVGGVIAVAAQSTRQGLMSSLKK